ncbi:MAG: hypothetical protein H7843_01205 [Nitrospirota bacterium]
MACWIDGKWSNAEPVKSINNNHRLHSAIDFMRPFDYYNGNPDHVNKIRQEKLNAAKKRRIEENRKFNLSLKA